MIRDLLKHSRQRLALAGANATTGLAGIFGVVLYFLQEEGKEYCFTLLELAGLALVAAVALELNRRNGHVE